MPFWQRFLITLAVILLVSYLGSMLWTLLSGLAMPGYLAGLLGGMAALPVWEFLKRVGPKAPKT